MKQLLLIFCTILYSVLIKGQKSENAAWYWVQFLDKAGGIYEVDHPEAFLSERSLTRRERSGIAVTEQDLPVSNAYLDSLRHAGIAIRYTSRWLNGAAALIDAGQLEGLRQTTFIDTIEYISPLLGETTGQDYQYKIDSTGMQMEASLYGRATQNIRMLNGDSLHQMGFRGENMYIGILDGGFTNVDKIPFFDSLHQYRQLSATFDFTDGDQVVFESSTHGTSVLSTMAAFQPGILVGTAPKARYACMKTEEVRGEYRMEEYNWVAALEYADSLGVDVVNSSLGYYHFSDRSMNYVPDQLDGMSSPASRAAGLAFDRGMIIVVSAGNEGNDRWRYIDVPADNPKALAVAAVMSNGQRANFSSFGFDSIAYIKPDLAAPGVHVPVPNAFRNRLSAASGTSLAAPIVCGLVTCLWQAFPELPNREIVAALKASASQADQPDRALGYGIPDFMKAYRWLQNRQKSLSE
ncbi:MAG: S8 family serine peptidase [Saprospiraceae bacterium]|nr:S8 family serine peptidase [Lewinella sp.]